MNKKPFKQQKNKKRFIPRVIEGYKSTTLPEKIGGFLALVILFAALAFNSGSNPVLLVSAVAGIFAVFNLLAYKPSLMFSTLVFAVHIAALPYVSLGYSFITPGEYSGDIITPMAILALATLVFSVLAYRFARGRYWVSLLAIFIAMDYLGITISSMIGAKWGTAMALIVSALTLTARIIPWRSLFGKNEDFISPTLANGSENKHTKKLLESMGYDVQELEDKWPLSHIAYSKKRVYLISTFTPRRAIVLNRERFYYDGAFIEPMIFEIVKTANEWCREHKIDAKYVSTVALVNNSDMFPSTDSVLSIQIAEKGDNHSLGQMHLVTPAGLDELNGEEVPHFPFKLYQKLEKEYPHA
jgi:hypothetical protein